MSARPARPEGAAPIAELIEDLKNPLWQRRREAADALAARGNAAVESLTAALSEPNEDLRYWATIILGRIGDQAVPSLVDALRRGSRDLRIFASRALGETRDPRAVPALIATLGDTAWSVRKAAADALKGIGAAAVAPLTEALGEPNEDVSYWAAKILGEIGDQASVEALIGVLRKGDRDKRFFAAIALGTTRDLRAIKALINSFRDESWTVRKNAAEALERIGECAIEPLTIALTHEDKDVRYWTTRVLGKIGSKSIQPVLKLLKDDDTEVRHLSKKILAQIGPTALEPLVRILRESPDKDMRKNAAEALGEIRNIAAIEPLIEALGDSSWFVRKTSADAIIQIGREAIPRLTEALVSDNEDVLYWITVILGSIGREAVYPLIDILKTGNKDMRFFAAEALGKIADPVALPHLIEALRDPSWPVRKNAAEALEAIGEAAVGPLIRALKNENNDVRFWTRKVLRNLGDAVVKPLTDYLRFGDDDLRIYAAFALGEIRLANAVPILVDALADANEWVRRYVVTALGEIGDPRAAGPILDSMAKETDEMRLLNSRVLYRFGLAAVPEIVRRFTKAHAAVIPYSAGVLKGLGKPALALAVREAARRDTPFALKVLADTLKSAGEEGRAAARSALAEAATPEERAFAERVLAQLG